MLQRAGDVVEESGDAPHPDRIAPTYRAIAREGARVMRVGGEGVCRLHCVSIRRTLIGKCMPAIDASAEVTLAAE